LWIESWVRGEQPQAEPDEPITTALCRILACSCCSILTRRTERNSGRFNSDDHKDVITVASGCPCESCAHVSLGRRCYILTTTTAHPKASETAT
jgi:hypothetical protein